MNKDKGLCVDAPISCKEATNKTCIAKDADCYAFRATSPDTQPHNNAKVGIMCIFDNDFRNNDNFEERIGTEYDVLELKELATFLNYEFIVYKNKTKSEILDILQKFDCKNMLTFNGFMCVFLSHGSNGGVNGSDGQEITFNDMQTAINGNPVNGLKDILKVFIIQACQGGGKEKEVSHNGIRLAESADYGIFEVHNPNPVSCHQINGGLSYIQTLCKVLKEHAATNSLLDMLFITSSETKMSPTALMTLTKSFHFNPKGRFNEHVSESTDFSISHSDSRDVCTDSLSHKESPKIYDSDNLHTILNNIPIVAESNTKCVNFETEMLMNPKQSNQITNVYPQNDLCIVDSQRDSINLTCLAKDLGCCASDATIPYATIPEMLMNPKQSNQITNVYPQNDLCIVDSQRDSINLTCLAKDLGCCASDATIPYATIPEMLMNPIKSNQISKFTPVFPYKDLCFDSRPSGAQSETTSLNHTNLAKDASCCTSSATISGLQLYNNMNPGICHIFYTSDKFLNIAFELVIVLEWLNCKVCKHEIEGGQNILDIIKNLPIIQENVSYFMCFFFGFEKNSNVKKLGVGDIRDAINSKTSELLIGKPKLFFFENCQVDENKNNIDSIQVDQNQITSKEQTSSVENAGFCFMLASTPGTLSIRHHNEGTWFIQAFCKISKKHAKYMPLCDIGTILHFEIATKRYEKCESSKKTVMKQMPIMIIKPLRKPIWLNLKEGI
ncbi:uncharacterized protein LOC136076920 isoform X2 [Hydra vulgaris]|uniref:Uncharacterized protein LOC136076920 isoform X2 n=1 Tax=Hydra vulgaris TaxID=6087 RepID=A0ABM4BD35_HYDVU